MAMPTIEIEGVAVPAFFYGTAWKEDATERLAHLALREGFRAIDTANQRKHYHEAGVGAGLARAIGEGLVSRDQVFVQSKFTHLPGQDHRLPYDPRAEVGTQVEQSFASSLEHLGVTRLDSLVLHGPSTRFGLAPQDVGAWRAMEAIARRGGTRFLGVSNVSAEQLASLLGTAAVKPRFVQNRCYAQLGWDREVRALCREHGAVYQGFSLLTANRHVLATPGVLGLAARKGCTVPQLVFAFSLALGMIVLTGTTSAQHMREDLEAPGVVLAPDEVAYLEALAG